MNAVRLRIACYGLFCGVLLATLASAAGYAPRLDLRLCAVFGAGAALGLVGSIAALRCHRRAGRPTGRALRALDVLAWNALAALLMGELAVRVAQRVAPSQWLWDGSDAAATILALRRCEPPLHFRYRCNSRGYPDDEFGLPAPGHYAVAMLADSFGAGSVPWAFNFASLAETQLADRLATRYRRVAIDNFGVNGANLLEYRWLYENEIRHRAYDQVVLCLFVGNDFEASEERGVGQGLRGLIRLQGWLAPEVVRRMFAVARGVEQLGATPGAAGEEEPAFLHDPSLEPPFFDEDEFLAIEVRRMRFALWQVPGLERTFERGFVVLDSLHAELGARLLVVVIPDEFQVNDALFEQVRDEAVQRLTSQRLPEGRGAFDRDWPQRRIAAWAAQRGARMLDLLPVLRAAESEGRTYHLRDTHWNAHGNRVAGRALAEALLAAADRTSAVGGHSAALDDPYTGARMAQP